MTSTGSEELPVERGAFYIMDRGYIDVQRLRRIDQTGAFFVIRDRCDVRYYVAEPRPVDRSTNLPQRPVHTGSMAPMLPSTGPACCAASASTILDTPAACLLGPIVGRRR